ncbi:MAG: hypothetical protein ACREJN_11475 [Nitrospiraceae bacterium]
MPSNWTKQLQNLSAAAGGFFLNGGAGDAVIGGQLTGVPAGLTISAGGQSIPGDRLVLGMADALIMSKLSVGTLFGGLFQYVTTFLTATGAATVNRGCFWRQASLDDSYTVTPDENGASGVGLNAGAYINTLTAGNSWWIQIAGKVKVLFRGTLSGTGAAGTAVYYAGAGAGADLGLFDTFGGVATAVTFSNISNFQLRFAGVTEAAAANGTASVITMPVGRMNRF